MVTASEHLTAGEKAIISSFDTSVKGLSFTSATTSKIKTLQGWIDWASEGTSLSLEDLTDWPSHANATPTNFAKLFDGSTVTGFHSHSEHASSVHSHSALSDLTDLDAAVGSEGFLKSAGVEEMFSTGQITTTNIQEGTNKYLTESNLMLLNPVSNLMQHMADLGTNEKHLTTGQRTALVSGMPTDIHSHEGLHYPVDNEITIGEHRPSIGNPTTVGRPGLIRVPNVAITAAAPVSSSAPGETGEIRSDGNYVYCKCPDGNWRRAALSTF